MTTEPTRSIPLHIGGREYNIVWHRLPDAPTSVTRWRFEVIRARLYAHAIPLLFLVLGLLLAVALVVAAVAVR
jgi:hypothetical protein